MWFFKVFICRWFGHKWAKCDITVIDFGKFKACRRCGFYEYGKKKGFI